MNSPEPASAQTPVRDDRAPTIVPVAVGVFLISLAVLAFEIALTRLFSVVMRYHFVFLVTSIAVCGLGLGGWAAQIAVRAGRLRCRLTTLGWQGFWFAITVAAAISFLLRVLLPRNPELYLVTAMMILVPFVFAGVFLSLAFHEFAAECGNLYGADLIGAALASLLVIVALQYTGAINACLLAGAAGAVCALVIAWREPGLLRWAAALAVVLNVALVAGNLRLKFLDIPPLPTRNPAAAAQITKPLYRDLAQTKTHAHIVYTEWNAFARTDVVEENDTDEKYVYTDGEVPTNMMPFSGDLNQVRYLMGFIGFYSYYFAPKNRLLCIGPGGGLDVVMGLLAGFHHIEGVEVNPAIPDVMQKYAKFNGHIYDMKNVDITVGDGRSYVRNSPRRYDLIYMALTQTATSGNIGLALVESYIHTQNAFRDYLDHLTPNGRLALVTQNFPVAERFFTTAVAALSEHGRMSEAEAARHIVVLSLPEQFYSSGPYRHLVMVCKQAVSAADARRYEKAAAALQLVPIFIPRVHEGFPFYEIADKERSLQQFVDDEKDKDGINIGPCTDDSPFFLDLSIGVPKEITQFGFVALLLLIGFSAYATWSFRRLPVPGVRNDGPSLPTFVLYFALLGAGFMLIEVALAQKLMLFLGYPTLTVSVILFSLLLGSAAGAVASQSWIRDRFASGIAAAGIGTAVLVAAYAVLLPIMQNRLLGVDIFTRSLIAMALLLLLGCGLGMPFPTGIRYLQQSARDAVPWMWGVNGVASVLGSVIAGAGAKVLGFRSVLMMGAMFYLFVALLMIEIEKRRVVGGIPVEPAPPAADLPGDG